MEPSTREQDLSNQRAWDALYASTSEFVWGAGEVSFLRAFLTPEIAVGRSFRRVLDAGTGEGRNLPFLLGLASEVSACDSSAAALAKIPATLRSAVRVECCELSQTPFGTGSFDLILLCDTVETLPDEISALRELRRILAPGGSLVCNFPESKGDVAGVEMTAMGDDRYLYRDRYYFKFFREEDVGRLLAATGWREERSEVMTWEEPPHPQFRPVAHQHRSRVYLLSRAADA